MDIMEFNGKYHNALHRLLENGLTELPREQARLRELSAAITDEDDRQFADEMIDDLPRRANPPQPSGLYKEALEIQQAAFFGGGSDEERMARLAEARRTIWAMADRADPSENERIRGLTRSLEHLERRTEELLEIWSEPPVERN